MKAQSRITSSAQRAESRSAAHCPQRKGRKYDETCIDDYGGDGYVIPSSRVRRAASFGTASCSDDIYDNTVLGLPSVAKVVLQQPLSLSHPWFRASHQHQGNAGIALPCAGILTPRQLPAENANHATMRFESPSVGLPMGPLIDLLLTGHTAVLPLA